MAERSISSNSAVSSVQRQLQEEKIQRMAQDLKIPYLAPPMPALNPDAVSTITIEQAQEWNALVLQRIGKILIVAITNPEIRETITAALPNWQIEWRLCGHVTWTEGLKQYNHPSLQRRTVKLATNVDEKASTKSRASSWQDLEKKIPQLATEVVLSNLQALALQSRASDIHYQPRLDNTVTIRLRIDGVLHDKIRLQPKDSERVVRQIKYQGGMRSNLTGIAQEGRLGFTINDRPIDVRISLLPTEHGESVVMRLLDSRKSLSDFPDLGFSESATQKIRRILRQKHGLILMTGPTGSGKTTTLYSMLQALNQNDRKIVTLEDPIEYHLDGVTQSQVSKEKGYDYEDGFKSLMRHDPDIAMIGEIRSNETAHLAIEAALTGHLVLSSLHTNTALDAILRLRNFEIEDYNLSSSVNAIIAQRLARRVCEHCQAREKVDLTQHQNLKEIWQRLQKRNHLQDIPSELTVAKGCDHCSNTGYWGRLAILEVAEFDEKLKDQVRQGASSAAMLKFIRENPEYKDYTTLEEDAALKLAQGLTTLDEFYRVILGASH